MITRIDVFNRSENRISKKNRCLIYCNDILRLDRNNWLGVSKKSRPGQNKYKKVNMP